MNQEIYQAIRIYEQAAQAEQQGVLRLAEVYYLKSGFASVEVGEAGCVQAVQSFEALTHLRQTAGDWVGAWAAAKRLAQVRLACPPIRVAPKAPAQPAS